MHPGECIVCEIVARPYRLCPKIYDPVVGRGHEVAGDESGSFGDDRMRGVDAGLRLGLTPFFRG